jgi:hypothetical protein
MTRARKSARISAYFSRLKRSWRVSLAMVSESVGLAQQGDGMFRGDEPSARAWAMWWPAMAQSLP